MVAPEPVQCRLKLDLCLFRSAAKSVIGHVGAVPAYYNPTLEVP
jgi:hypothetical protein